MGATTFNVVLMLRLFLCITSIQLITCNQDSNNGCRETERVALLKFKESLIDPSDRLSNWVGKDCCKWEGVRCSNQSGHVTKLKLRGPYLAKNSAKYLGGELNPSLLELKYLVYLDLSNNYFDWIGIPEFIGSLTRLSCLNISHAAFGGTIPHQLGNLTHLRYLDFRADDIVVGERRDVVVDDLHRLSRLSSLRYLDMSNIYLAGADVFHAVSGLSNLSVLLLSDCNLDDIPISLSNINLASLATLDLSWNSFNSIIPTWLFNIRNLVSVDLSGNSLHASISGFENLTSLQVLKLGRNNFNASIPINLRNLCHLRTLDLSSNGIGGDISMLEESLDGCARYNLQTLDLGHNLLSGQLPDSMGEFRNLTALHLEGNLLSGSIPESIWKLSKLVVLDLSYNSFQGVVTDAHLTNLTSLQALFLSSNSLVMRLSPDWVPQFQLKQIHMDSCILGPLFPAWLRTQRAFSTINISNASISDIMPDWFWNLSSRVIYLNLSHNQITGSIPVSATFRDIKVVDLRSNKFHGPLPSVGDGVNYLYLSDNLFSGDLLPILNKSATVLFSISLSRNFISGNIPTSICNVSSLEILDLSHNLLSGEIPRCSEGPSFLSVINLASNNFSGVIPHWIGSLTSIESLHLNNNFFHGEIPTLENCTQLYILDLGDNELTGNIPAWIGENLLGLRILRLRSNMLGGTIPLLLLNYLQVLDLAENNLVGLVPRWLGNLSAMVSTEQRITHFRPISGIYGLEDKVDYESIVELSAQYEESLLVEIKGLKLEYGKTYSLVVSLDLSGNDLSGDIPDELTSLLGLQNLNLSRNHLTGAIPRNIGHLRQLASVDLSKNQLSGVIPSSISSLAYLSYLNLSYNNLSGRIPSGNQLQVLPDSSIYAGNNDLCGTPLPNKCPGDEIPQVQLPEASTKEGDESETLWCYLGAVLGFIMGFWSFYGTLLLKKSWRVSYYNFIDRMTT